MSSHKIQLLIHKLYCPTTFLFVRNLKTQIEETGLNIVQELEKRKPKKVVVIGPGVSPYIYQLANIFDAYFIALDIRRCCLETLASLGLPVKLEKLVKKIVETYELKKDEEKEVREVIEAIVEASKKVAEYTNYYPVRNYWNYKIDFVQGNAAFLPFKNLDAILMFNVIDYLKLEDSLNLFKSISNSLDSKGFFCVSGPIQRLGISYLRLLNRNKYRLICLKETPDNSYKSLEFSLKNLIPKEMKWNVIKTEKYFCLYGEKN